MRVLVVDDDPSVLEIVCRMVERLGHTVVKSRDGADAKQLILNGEVFGAIISDNNMSKMDGIDFLRWFRSEFEPVATTILIISSGRESEKINELCRQFGDIKKMSKPIWSERLGKILI